MHVALNIFMAYKASYDKSIGGGNKTLQKQILTPPNLTHGPIATYAFQSPKFGHLSQTHIKATASY